MKEMIEFLKYTAYGVIPGIIIGVVGWYLINKYFPIPDKRKESE